MKGRKRVAVLISGRGSNMEALIAAATAAEYPAEICAVFSNRADAPGLETARLRGIPARSVPHRDFASREAHEDAMHAALAAAKPDIVCLAGYMRLLTPAFVARWRGRLINIHPSLLPAFPGLDTHGRALGAGVRLHGCSVHFVTEVMDEGPIIAQAAVPVLAQDDEDTLGARVLKAEHRLYAAALAMVARGEARMNGDRVDFASKAQQIADAVLVSPSYGQGSGETDLEHLARFTP